MDFLDNSTYKVNFKDSVVFLEFWISRFSYCHNFRKSKSLVLSKIQKFRNSATHKYFTFDSRTSSFISLITYVFLVSQTFGFCTYL